MNDYKPLERQRLEELYRKQNVRINELEQENRKLKEDNRFLTKISKEYMKKENIIEITEFTELYKAELEEENRSLKNELMEDMKTETKLNERIRFLEQCLDNKEKVNKSLREENNKLKSELQKWLNAVGNH